MGGLYDDLPAARGDVEGDGDDDGGVHARASEMSENGKPRATTTTARAEGSGEEKKPTASIAWASRAQASALRLARSRTKRDAEERARALARRKRLENQAHAIEETRGEAERTVVIETNLGEGATGDRYDPRAPNDYERTLRERRARAAAAREETRVRERLEREERKRRESEAQDERTGVRERRLRVLLEESGTDVRRRRLAQTRVGAEASTGEPSGGGKKMSAAEKMMEKMGWTKGRGLGKDEQGMTTPLEVRKDSAGATGKIINARPVFDVSAITSSTGRGLGLGETSEGKSVDPSPTPTRVLLLRNIVLAGGVTEATEDQVADECEKYGDVVRVLIFEITEDGFAIDEAVRIFTEFVDEEAATRALENLHGNVFANRVVKASYFDVKKFEAGDLGPQEGEM
ncbi:Nucleotide-binding, alpha-beta plait [Ostreococcus tauri]|uniref:Nucleotide-binding, alpha-beta plait n=1 Tax=Ostreococcus tauri TaxID=70448 RepID=A0A096PBU3_OSTTA|nr:Nucleotide-binding, alpha-beta plait [Ostreococcus tauri]CEG02132.1 Nucleotide-binding, alpha-beta plait [Ostreococcus tauri]|eukprot:XP_003083054.2 Nucleotide-binding, alpha-beta plait [Ostreococcus tauri]